MIQARTSGIPRIDPSSRWGAAWLRTGELLESDRAGWLLCATGMLALALSAAAAMVSKPDSTVATLSAAAIAAIGLVVALGLPLRPALALPAGAAAVMVTGLYAATVFESTPTVVWLFAYLVPAVGLARGPMAGGVAGLIAAPVLHLVETGVLFEPLDPQVRSGS